MSFGHLLCQMSLKLGLEKIEVMHFGKNTTEVMLCPSQNIMSGIIMLIFFILT